MNIAITVDNDEWSLWVSILKGGRALSEIYRTERRANGFWEEASENQMGLEGIGIESC
jgi:hypothetical protein